jgi:hypothetical protein
MSDKCNDEFWNRDTKHGVIRCQKAAGHHRWHESDIGKNVLKWRHFTPRERARFERERRAGK